MARPRRISDAQIQDAARATFLEHGPSAPVALVAEKLGVSQAALFHRVGSKERLLREALCPGAPAAAAVLARGPDRARSVRDQLVPILDELLAFHRAIVPGLVVLRSSGMAMEDALGEGTPPPVILRRLLSAWLTACEVQSAAMIAEALLGALEARCFNAHLGGAAYAPGDDASFTRALVEALVPEARATNVPSKRAPTKTRARMRRARSKE